MIISEIFHSVQGEGLHTGEPTTFIRFGGCTLGCSWCDTKYTWPKSSKNYLGNLSIEDIIEQVKAITPESTKWICITGGEPLEQLKELSDLISYIKNLNLKIEIETSGLLPIIEVGKTPFSFIDSWVVDLKCPSSEVLKENCWDNYRLLTKEDQIKVVVGDEKDLEFIEDCLEKYPTNAKILISPLFSEHQEINQRLRELCAEYCKLRGYRLSLQIHKFIWGSKRGV